MRFTIWSRKEKSSIWYTAFLLSQSTPYSDRMAGNLGHAGVDCAQGEPIREGPRKYPVLDLSGKVERARALV